MSLLYGHRISVDIDLFSAKPFENDTVIEALKSKYESRITLEQKQVKFGIFCYIDQVKVDLIHHPHQLVRQTQDKEGIRMFSVEDMIAMKVQAILGRGRKKDFWDVAELLNHFPVSAFVDLHKEKYSTQNLLISVPQALTYFADADEDEDPVSLKGQTWKTVQENINKYVRHFLK